MPSLRGLLSLLVTTPVALAADPGGLGAQALARYRVSPDTLWIESRNPHRMYWVQGADTVGNRTPARAIERQVWRTGPGGALAVEVRMATLGVARRERVDTFTVAPDGRVTLINGRAPGLHERVDLVPRLPSGPLAPGVTWSDTLHTDNRGPVVDHAYRVERRHRATRTLDTLGARVVEVTAEGTVRYRDGWWADSAAGTFAWLDVSGPLQETFWVDPARGRLVARRWRMDLRGTGGLPRAGGGVDTVPAGLESEDTQAPLPAARAAALARSLPVGDTTITVAGERGAVLLHTVTRAGNEVRAGLARNDGALGTAVLRLGADGVPTGYEAVWSDSTGARQEYRAVPRAGKLAVTRAGRDTVVSLPTGAWAVADYGMDELLVPALLRLPQDFQPHPVAVYRPYAGRWDAGVALVREANGVLLAVVHLGDAAEDPAAFVLTPDGELLMREQGGASASQRVPRPGSPSRARLEALLATLRAGQD